MRGVVFFAKAKNTPAGRRLLRCKCLSVLVMRGVVFFAKAKNTPAGRRLKKSKINFGLLLGSYCVRTPTGFSPLSLPCIENTQPEG